ncbi:antitoxin [Catenulispora subtropica]|uniref:Antitoxin n=1 Tax=Catenulispora subtropica TaxID=450798 RepID=A0ABN2QLJ0_9ACTN
MGIFDVFKTKVNEAPDKASDLMDKKDEPSEAGTSVEDEASNMVSEGAPVSAVGEAAPGAGDEAAAAGGSGGMTQSIKDNVASGVEKAGDMAKSKTGGKYDDKIDSGVRKARDMLR